MPYPRDEPYRECVSCHRPVAARRWRRGSRKCPDCAEAASIINAVELAAKHGNSYNRWRAGVLRYAERVSRETSQELDAADADQGERD